MEGLVQVRPLSLKLLVNNIECDYLYINASDENSVDVVRNKVRGFASTIGFKDMKVVILDECDYITPNAQAALRNLMETFSKHTRFILTCNYVERIIDPIQSRCQPFQIVPPSRKEVCVHLSDILKKENVESEVDDVATLVNGGYPDIRRVINFVQRQVVDGKLSIDQNNLVAVDLNVNVFSTQVVNVLKTQSKKDHFVTIRKMLGDNQISDFADVFRFCMTKLMIMVKV